MDSLRQQLEDERTARMKADKLCNDLQRQVDMLTEQTDADHAALQNQIEQNRKREIDLQKIQNDLSEAQELSDSQLASLRKKNVDIQNECRDQLETLYKNRHRLEKEKQQLQIELDELSGTIDDLTKEKAAAERTNKQLEQTLAEAQTKLSELHRQVSDLSAVKTRSLADNSELTRKLDDLQTELSLANRAKLALAEQVDDARTSADNEKKLCSKMASDNRALQTVIEELRIQLEEEEERRAGVQRQLTKATNEIAVLKDTLESVVAENQTEELEEAKRKMAARIQECEMQLGVAVGKANNLEKQKNQLQIDCDTRSTELSKCQAVIIQTEKKQKQLEKTVEEWKRRAVELEKESNKLQKECHAQSSQLYAFKSGLEESRETGETLRRENKHLSEEIQDLTGQLSETCRKLMDSEKNCKRVEHEKDELQRRLEEMEATLNQEASKLQRAYVDLNNFKVEVERRHTEKEEELENQRKSHQRALDAMQASLEAETRSKQEIIRQRKKLEQELIDLENLLEDTNHARCEAEKSFKKLSEKLSNLELSIEDEQLLSQRSKDAQAAADKKTAQLLNEIQQLRRELDASERANKALASELQEALDKVGDVTAALNALTEVKRQLEIEIQTAKMEKDDYENDLKSAEDRSKKALADAAQLAEDLRVEQGRVAQLEQSKRGAEARAKELQAKLDECEATAMQGGKKIVQKLEQKVHELELELESEQHRHSETVKAMSRQEKKLAELGGMIEEQRAHRERLQELIDKSQQKLKIYKRQLDIAEETANTNLIKFRKIHQEYEEAVDRATTAETSLNQLRTRNRQSSVDPSIRGTTPSRSSDNSLSSTRLGRASSVF